jgi:hypothetical protein
MTPPAKAIILFSFLTFALAVTAQKAKPSPDDSTSYSVKTVTIEGKKHTGFLNISGFYLLNFQNKTVVFKPGDYFTWEVKDFNGDGNKDLFLDKRGNTPERYDLLLFVSANHYRQVEEFELFPAPTQIKGTKYFYSYHKSGCADMNWDSDLFFLQDFKAVRIGNISGRECENSGIKDGVYISKVRGEKKTLVKTLSVSTLAKYKDYKWGLIKDYWMKNYKQFL